MLVKRAPGGNCDISYNKAIPKSPPNLLVENKKYFYFSHLQIPNDILQDILIISKTCEQ